MSKFVIEIPVGFNYSTIVEAENIEDAIKKTIKKCENEHPFLDLEFDKNNVFYIEK